ncbi:hypothetical protein [Luteimonas fraxinea]|uniref:hypothetical protein n=1 Tax=Luteimonas fraxinea TaxID=2901869 RepID=UPI001E5796F5|nr:hypothetical protein [Luteimonas fraxinea]MCD9126681.1 hypothetical protein [Luteimonas fraxinea]
MSTVADLPAVYTELRISHEDLARRRRMALAALREDIRNEFAIHEDHCAWMCGGACSCECTLVFVSATRLTAVGIDLSQITLRRH